MFNMIVKTCLYQVLEHLQVNMVVFIYPVNILSNPVTFFLYHEFPFFFFTRFEATAFPVCLLSHHSLLRFIYFFAMLISFKWDVCERYNVLPASLGMYKVTLR